MLVSELVRVSSTPQVIALSQIEEIKRGLRQGATPPGAADILERYLVTEPDSRLAVESILHGLSAEQGHTWLVCGPYGSGKTHLLGVLSLLCDFPECWPRFAETHPQLARFAPRSERRRLVVQLSLDEHSSVASLEGLVFARIEAELAAPWHDIWAPLTETAAYLDLVERSVVPGRQEEWAAFLVRSGVDDWTQLKAASPTRAAEIAHSFLRQIGLPLDSRRSRAEALFALFEHLAGRGYGGMVLLVDELSTFLAAKDKRALNRDAAFLQFLAQQAESAPLWLVATAQRSLEDVGDIDSNTLRQLRDRFRSRFTLSTAEIRHVVAERLIERVDPARYAARLTALHAEYTQQVGHAPFSADELALCYPLNPHILDCLEAIASSYLSATRGLIGMVQRGIIGAAEGDGLLSEPAERLLTLDRVFEVECHELLALPEADRFRQAWEFMSRNLRSLVAAEDVTAAETLIRTLLLLSMAGLRWSAKRLADSLVGGRERRLWGNWQEVERLLRRLWRKGAFVEMVRAAEPGESEFFIDARSDTSEVVRRRLNEALASLSDDDDRVAEWALQACQRDDLPLARHLTASPVAFDWLGTKRHVTVLCGRPSDLQPGRLAQVAANLALPASREDGWLLVCPPYADIAREVSAWRRQRQDLDGRYGDAVLAWFPRLLQEHEWESVCEHAALQLLLSDATFSASRKGREVRLRLEERLASAREECRRALTRAYREGEIAGREMAPVAVAAADDAVWPEVIEEHFSRALAQVFPNFASVAPRQRLAGKLQTNQLIERFIRPGQAAAGTTGTLEEHIAGVLEPLGFVCREEGRLRLSVSPRPLVDHVLGLLPATAGAPGPESVLSYRDLEGAARKGSFGLSPELVELMVGALTRTGYLRAVDGFMEPLDFGDIALPLADNLPYLMRGSPLTPEQHAWLSAASGRLFGQEPVHEEVGAQGAAWERLRGWASRALGDLPEVEQRLQGFVESLGQEDVRWTANRAALHQVGRILSESATAEAAVPGAGGLLETCVRVAGSGDAALDALERFARLRAFLRQHAPDLTTAARFVADEQLSLDGQPELAEQAEALREALASGELLIPRAAEVVTCWRSFHSSYRERYQDWHARQHAPERFRPLVDLAKSALVTGGEHLATAMADEGASCREATAELRTALARHCIGAELPAALETSPVCPACGLRLGSELRLPDPQGLRGRLTAAVAAMTAALRSEERLVLLRERARDEASTTLREEIERLAGSADQALLTPEAATWIARQLRRRVAARRDAAELVELLRGRQVTREQAVRLFLEWFERPGALGEDDLIAID